MRKLIIILLITIFTTILIVNAKANLFAYIQTGHDDFREIIFEDKSVCLLVKRRKEEIDEVLNKLPKKTFGWSTYYFNVESKASYVGDTVFSRSNRTSEPITVSYHLREEDFDSTSIKITGSVDAKVTAQTEKKTVSGTLNPSFGFTKNTTNTYSKEEVSEFKINITPYTMISLRIVGECYVTSAVNKYYLFGIQLRKGQWEKVEVETMFYELYEEKLA